jgi:cytochrome c-type biogenesis protein CcmH/NrfG
MKSAKGAALVLSGAIIVYLLLLGQIGWGLIASGSAIGIALGIAILVFPLFGVWIVWRELTFGFRAQRLQEQWQIEELPVPEANEAEFQYCRSQVELEPNDWHNWFRLGLAYAVAGDKSRARSAIKQADYLFHRGEAA